MAGAYPLYTAAAPTGLTQAPQGRLHPGGQRPYGAKGGRPFLGVVVAAGRPLPGLSGSGAWRLAAGLGD